MVCIQRGMYKKGTFLRYYIQQTTDKTDMDHKDEIIAGKRPRNSTVIYLEERVFVVKVRQS